MAKGDGNRSIQENAVAKGDGNRSIWEKAMKAADRGNGSTMVRIR